MQQLRFICPFHAAIILFDFIVVIRTFPQKSVGEAAFPYRITSAFERLLYVYMKTFDNLTLRSTYKAVLSGDCALQLTNPPSK